MAVAAEANEDSSEMATATASGQTTAVTSCHTHETAVYCIDGAGSEVQVEATPTGELPAAYTGCHSHGSETYCLDPEGNEVAIVSEAAAATTSDSEEENVHCHFHAGVE